MMDLSIFLQLAQIAAAYIGFASLVTAASGQSETTYIQFQSFISISLLVITGSLLPIVIGSFPLEDNLLWRICSGVFLFWNWSAIGVCSYIARRRKLLLIESVGQGLQRLFFWGMEVFVQTPLWLILFGIINSHAGTLYLIVMIINVIQATQLFVQMATALNPQED